VAHRILISSQAPFIQALVQKSVTAITNLAGRLSSRMLREGPAFAQEAKAKKVGTKVASEGKILPRIYADFHRF
jgi:hypothetical protein